MSTPIQTSNGLAVSFGFAGAINIAVPSALTGTIILQSVDETNEADVATVEDEQGTRVARSWYDPRAEADFKTVIKGTGLAAVITVVQAIQSNCLPGTLLNITSCPSMTDLVGSTWELQTGVKVTGTNKSAKELTFKLVRSPGITQTMPA